MKQKFMKFYSPNDSESLSDLAVARILTFAFLIWKTWDLSHFVHFGDLGEVMQTSGGLSIPRVYSLAQELFQYTSVYNASMVLAALGFLTPVCVTICFVFLAVGVSYSFSFGHSSHDMLPLVPLLGFLIFSGSGRKLSIDRFLFYRGHSELDHQKARFANFSVRALFVVIVFSSGITKLRLSGWEWAFSDNLQNILIRQNIYFADMIDSYLQPLSNHIVTSIPYLAMILAAGTLALDLLAPLALFKRFFYYKFLILFAAFQVGSYLTMYVNFSNWLPLYFFWIPWTCAYERVRQNLVRPDERIPGRNL